MAPGADRQQLPGKEKEEKRKMVPASQSTKTASADWKEAESGCVDCAQKKKKKKNRRWCPRTEGDMKMVATSSRLAVDSWEA